MVNKLLAAKYFPRNVAGFSERGKEERHKKKKKKNSHNYNNKIFTLIQTQQNATTLLEGDPKLIMRGAISIIEVIQMLRCLSSPISSIFFIPQKNFVRYKLRHQSN